jgi:hypothetical protein
MIKTFGEFSEGSPSLNEYFIFGFSPNSKISFEELWKTNGLLADCLANYLAIFYPSHDVQELKEDVGYIANELLENARKFNDKNSKEPFAIQFELSDNDYLVLRTTNSIAPENVAGFQSFIQKLLTSEPQELYIHQIKQTKENNSTATSQLGLLMMIKNYGVKFGWKFETVNQDSKMINVTTMLQLAIK